MNPLFFYACIFSVLAYLTIGLVDRNNTINSQGLTRLALLMLICLPALLLLPKWHVASAPAGLHRMIEAAEQSTPTWLWIFWLLGALVCLIRVAISLWQLHVWKKNSTEITTSPLVNEVRSCREKMNYPRGIALRVLDNHKGPAACGILRPTIYLPRNWQNWTEETLRAVLLHEIGHHVSRDPLWRMVSLISTSIHWYNPFVCWLSSKQQLQSEIACDDRVVRSGFHQDAYANILCDLASHAPHSAMAMASPGGLETRVRQLGLKRTQPGRLWLTVFMFVLLLSALILAILRPSHDPGMPLPPTPEDSRLRLQADPFPGG